MKHAELGTVISGTMRTQDLIPAFTEKLKELDEAGEYTDLIHDCEHYKKFTPEEQACMLNEELFDALNNFAPPYCHFGSNPGDGSDYGFWVSENIEEDFDGLRVSDLSEVDEEYVGEVLLVNDHGNMTLYYKCPYGFHEIWAVV